MIKERKYQIHEHPWRIQSFAGYSPNVTFGCGSQKLLLLHFSVFPIELWRILWQKLQSKQTDKLVDIH